MSDLPPAGDRKPEGPPDGWAPDLALARARLRPDWIVRWLHDPQKLQPGTKMPAYFPGGPPDILGGDQTKQMQAVKDYVLNLGQDLPGSTYSDAKGKYPRITPGARPRRERQARPSRFLDGLRRDRPAGC